MLKEYENQEIVSSQKYFVKRLKKIFSMIYPSVDNKKLDEMMEESMSWVKKINWEKLKEDMLPFVNSGGLRSFKEEIYRTCEKKESGGCYYLLRNTWSRGKDNKECSSGQWECRVDGRGRTIGTWIHEDALLDNLHKIFYLTKDSLQFSF